MFKTYQKKSKRVLLHLNSPYQHQYKGVWRFPASNSDSALLQGTTGVSRMPPKDKLTPGEMEAVTMAFRQYETGLREACIDAKV